MKGFWLPLCLALILFGLMSTTSQAQILEGQPQIFEEQGNASSFRSQVHTPFMDLIYFGITGVDEGLGYNGPYGTVGAKKRLGEDQFGGSWFAEIRGNVSIDSGNFFGSGGIERQIHIAPAGADVGIGVYYDFDGDRAQDFGHDFQQIGINTFIKTDAFDVTGNIFIPVKQETFLFAPLSGVGAGFSGYNILKQNGFDAALEGFDAKLEVPIPDLAMMATNVYLGGYFYRSEVDIVDAFGGFRAGVNLQSDYGVLFRAELNHDDLHQTTVLGQVVINLGAHGSISRSGRDLEAADRPEHIVRVNQAPILLSNPKTGAPWRIVHVDNTAAAGGDGTFERPLTTLAAAGAPLSGMGDIIFVRDGDGTSTGMDTGIVLQDMQLLLGDGVAHFIPTVECGLFQLPTDTDGITPNITNLGGTAVRLADDNTVRGFNIDSAITAIDTLPGGANTLTLIDQVNITNGTTGIDINGGVGAYTFTDVNIGAAGMSTSTNALRIRGGTAPVLTYQSGTITTESGFSVNVDGITGGLLTFTNTIDDSTNATGIRINDAMGVFGADLIRFDGPVNLNASTGDGISITATTTDTIGNIVFSNTNITDRQGTALTMTDPNAGTFDNRAAVSFTGSMSAAAGINPDGAILVDVNNDPGSLAGGSLTFATGSNINYNSLGPGDTGIDIDANNLDFSAIFRDVTISATSAGATNIRLSNIDDVAALANDIDFAGTTNLTGVAAQGVGQGIDINGGATSIGTINFDDLRITGVNGNAVDVNGGSNTIAMNLGGGGINNSANRSVSIQNMTGGGVTFSGSGITDTGTGILVSGNMAPAGGDLLIDFTNQVDINTGAGLAGSFAVDINGNLINGAADIIHTRFADLDITTTTQGGLRVTNTLANNANQVTITTGSISTNGTNANPAGPAVDIDNSVLDMTFTSITSLESTGDGVSLDAVTTGSTFNVTGLTRINDPTTNGIAIENTVGTSTFTFNNVDIDAATNGIFFNNNDPLGTYAVSGGASTIDGSSGNGIRLVDSDGRFDNFTITQPNSSANASIFASASAGIVTRIQVTNTTTENGGGTGTGHAVQLLSDGAGAELNYTGTANTHNLENGLTTFVISSNANNAGTIDLDINGNAATADTNNASRTFDFNDDGTGIHNIDTHANAAAVTAANNGIGVDSAGITGTLNFGTAVIDTPN